MTTIVVPLDGSVFAERAIRPACSIAARLEQARVLLVSCAPDDIDAAQHELDDRARLYSEVVDIETRIVGGGDPAEVILAIAATEPDGMLCMATRGKGGIRAALLGSVSTEVVCRSTQPLVLVGPHCRTTLLPAERGRLLVCSDGSTLSDSIIPTAATWCDRLQLEPWLTEVVGPDEDPEPAPSTSSQPRGRSGEGASGHAGDPTAHTDISCENQSPPRHLEQLDCLVRRASSRRAGRHGDPRARRTDTHHHGQRRHRGRPPRPVPGPDHTADGRPGVRRRVTPHNSSEGDEDGSDHCWHRRFGGLAAPPCDGQLARPLPKVPGFGRSQSGSIPPAP